MAEKLDLPVWSEREYPTTYHIDRHEPGRDYSILPEADRGRNDDYVAWINSYKEPLHDSIRAVHPRTVERLARRDISLSAINELVSQVTERPPYPLERVVTASDLRSDPEYTAASKDGFFTKAMHFGEGGISFGQFEYILHFVRLRQSYIDRAAKSGVVDVAAHELGHAILAPVTYVHLDRLDTGNKVYHWFGYSWRYNDRYYGELLDEASAAKVAAVTRRELGFVKKQDSSAPVAEAYHENKGFSYASTMAVALDLLNQAAGHTDELAIYRPLWSFMTNTQDEAARDELAAIIRRASDSQVSLELLEAAQLSTKGLSLAILRQIEEACNIESHMRPSRFIRKVGIQ
jgi:hypothetical protein